jgi:hypothetical protein
MKHILTMAAIAAFTFAPSSQLLAQSAAAQAQAGSLAASQSGSLSGSQSGSNLTINNTGTPTQTIQNTGTRTLKTAPDVIAPSLGSGHPCMINTSVGISIIGGGASGGRGEVDYGCMMMRSASAVDNMAGRYYYAGKNVDACIAFRNAGAIVANYACSEKEKRAKRRARELAAQQPTATMSFAPVVSNKLYEKCYRREDGMLTVGYWKGETNKEAANNQCRKDIKG